MSELFKSAISYFNNGITGSESNDFVNQIVEVNGLKLHIKRVIAEGKLLLIFLQHPLQKKIKKFEVSPSKS